MCVYVRVRVLANLTQKNEPGLKALKSTVCTEHEVAGSRAPSGGPNSLSQHLPATPNPRTYKIDLRWGTSASKPGAWPLCALGLLSASWVQPLMPTRIRLPWAGKRVREGCSEEGGLKPTGEDGRRVGA